MKTWLYIILPLTTKFNTFIVHFVIYLHVCNLIVQNHNGSTASLLTVTYNKLKNFTPKISTDLYSNCAQKTMLDFVKKKIVFLIHNIHNKLKGKYNATPAKLLTLTTDGAEHRNGSTNLVKLPNTNLIKILYAFLDI
jgi:hypothetical protein